MDFKWLHTFITAAKYENFRKTAEALYISQPTVSVHMKLLEEEIGSPLFQREGRKVLLTEEGRTFLPVAKRLLQVYENGLEDMEQYRQGYSQKLALAMSPLIGESIMPFVLKKFMTIHPEIDISIKVLESTYIADAVLSGEVDLGLSRLEVKHSELKCRPLYEDPVLLVVPHDGADSESAPPLDARDVLRNNTLFTHNHPEYWEGMLRTLRAEFPLLRTMLVSQVHVTRRFIIEGLGVSFLPESTVRRELAEGRLLSVPCPFLQMPVARTYAVLKYEHRKERQFLEFLSQFRF
ncbi:HTH-type transcriptional regulator CitR [Weizmannia acidilactici]|uniref:HTH-type transcriptional regulator CitR n=1 Tax=Weizmannia acidilactici TaxID=2607726 RepID=A0A5J4J7P8_9BACI|nr:LysR family transcriptional regulator [Weizmannia acidilactici]GER68093.1 HTH-type transcriptional regulator CitR [Weizmannia acidilactici]GER70936.1 HTH-type transcriptional regulator CitR [Weizmannia acidilactici]GER73949.1 HTH-type transcriptional regulator CitR [Weizmannia acidilactici]